MDFKQHLKEGGGFLCWFSLLILVGCAGHIAPEKSELHGVDGVACVGYIDQPPEGVVAEEDKSLLDESLGVTGEGKLCAGKTFVATKPVKVYRVWNSQKDYSKYGRWWSFQVPHGPKQQYREQNVICPSWSTLDRMSECTLKAGTKLVVGPGQSANCLSTSYPKSAVNQVFVPNDSRKDILYVENCTPGDVWP
ncbi:hypothetical protein KCM76_18260 [Zooshikella marina]|uniref:hypothetical protein n=1 Tax=Zooshikella ganghwensis TaxID=202772 RepID=UPI001BB0601D|nr:hypothetical protein [Zooshikella ganghwensis]MBU2707945.1 hypothetical protein [Zooshikella ganghwensis]